MMSFSLFRICTITSLLLEEFGKARQIDLLDFKRQFYRIILTTMVLIFSDHAFYFLEGSSRLCCWNWWPGSYGFSVFT